MTAHPRSGRGPLRSVLVAALALSALIPFLYRLDRASFHLDETSWIIASDRLVRPSIGSAALPDPYETNFGWPSPPVGKYIMGAAIRLRAGGSAAALGETRWATYDRPIVASLAARQVPPLDALVAARLPNAILGAATCLVVFLLGKAAWGTRAGLIAGGLLALNPLMLVVCRRAMIDAPAIFLSSVAVLLAGRMAGDLLDPAASRRFLVSAGVLGIVLGLAVSSKLNALAAAIACTAVVALLAARARRPGIGLAVVGILAGTAGAVFIAVNPYLWEEPIGRAIAIVTYVHYKGGLGGFGERLLLVIRRLFAGEPDPTGVSYLTLGALARIPLEWVAIPAGFALAAISAALSWLRPGARRTSGIGPETAIVIWWGVTVAAVAAWIPRDWERYYLPVLPPTILLAARAIDAALASLIALRIRRTSRTGP